MFSKEIYSQRVVLFNVVLLQEAFIICFNYVPLYSCSCFRGNLQYSESGIGKKNLSKREAIGVSSPKMFLGIQIMKCNSF